MAASSSLLFWRGKGDKNIKSFLMDTLIYNPWPLFSYYYSNNNQGEYPFFHNTFRKKKLITLKYLPAPWIREKTLYQITCGTRFLAFFIGSNSFRFVIVYRLYNEGTEITGGGGETYFYFAEV